MLPRDWQLIDGWDRQVFLGPLKQVIIMISEPRTLRVISKNLSEQLKHCSKKIIKDNQKTINDVLFISSLLSFQSMSLQLLLSFSESTIDLFSFSSSIHSFHSLILWGRLDFFAINFILKFIKLVIEFKYFPTVLLFPCNFIRQQCISSFDRLFTFIMIK